MRYRSFWIIVVSAALTLAGCDALGDAETVTKTIYVGPEKVSCAGESPQFCFLVKEGANAEYHLWYDEIDELDYEPGFEYEVLIAESPVENPPAGASSIRWEVVEVVGKTPVEGGGSTDAADSAAVNEGTEDSITNEAVVELAPFVPIAVDDMGITTVAPADWPKIENDPLLKDAWGPGQYRFVAFHAVPGEDVVAAMAELLSTTTDELAAGAIDGAYWQEEIGNYTWGMYSIENPDVGLAQTVSMTEQNGKIYIVSLFVEMIYKDAILQALLENFAVAGLVQDTSEPIVAAGTAEEQPQDPAALAGTSWVLVAYNDGAGQVLDVPPGVEISAEFHSNGRVSGSAGCNDYVSLYTFSGDLLTITLPAMTRETCDNQPDIMLYETSYLGNLTAATAPQIDGNRLHLFDTAGDLLLTFEQS